MAKKKPRGVALSGSITPEFVRTELIDGVEWDRWKVKGIPNPFAAALGKRGGSVTSDRKASASRANGKRGGRPRKEGTANGAHGKPR